MTSGSYEGEVGRHPVFIWTMIPLCVLAVLLNLLVIGGVWKYGRFKYCVDIFLVNLAFSEIWQSAVVFPIYLRNIVKAPDEDFYGGQAVCKITMFLPLMIVMSAILSMVVMAIDRYRCIIQQKNMTRTTALVLVGIVWLLSLITSSPQLYEYNLYEKHLPDLNITIKSCGSEHIVKNFEEIYASLVFTICFILPLIVLTVCYGKVLRFVWKNANMFSSRSRRRQVVPMEMLQAQQAGQAEKNVTARKVKVVKMLINITASFTVLWTPYFILFALTEIMHLDDSSYHLQWPHVIGRSLTVLSTLVNPIISIHFSDKLRTRLICLLSFSSCKSSANRMQRINTVTTVSKSPKPTGKQPIIDQFETKVAHLAFNTGSDPTATEMKSSKSVISSTF